MYYPKKLLTTKQQKKVIFMSNSNIIRKQTEVSSIQPVLNILFDITHIYDEGNFQWVVLENPHGFSFRYFHLKMSSYKGIFFLDSDEYQSMIFKGIVLPPTLCYFCSTLNVYNVLFDP